MVMKMTPVDLSQTKSRRRKLYSILAWTTLIGFYVLGTLWQPKPHIGIRRLYSRRRRRRLEPTLSRPIMYTYYEPAITDMTPQADQDLLENWKKAWYDAGWEPRVLSEADAKKLPEYDALLQLIVDAKAIGTYNMACYIRWIAMAAVGGGFMSDYDTFPLNHFLRHGRELPFAGQLTIYQGHVPSLVSGNGSEYFRIAKKIGLSMQQHVYRQKHINKFGPKEAWKKHVKWSDMLALTELKKVSDDMFIQRREVVNGIDALQVPIWTSKECEMARGARAIHFSHKAIKEGKQSFRGAIHRATVARQFINMFHATCPYTKVADPF